jgi:hypothetical protein
MIILNQCKCSLFTASRVSLKSNRYILQEFGIAIAAILSTLEVSSVFHRLTINELMATQTR